MERIHALPGGANLFLCGTVAPARLKGIVLLCPGGGFEWLSPREGEIMAKYFIDAGWLAGVVHYSVFKGSPLGDAPIRQLGAAVGIMKGIFPDKPVVAAGFSAGGHVACGLGVHWKTLGLARPDALVLGYPLVTAGKYGHAPTMVYIAGDGDTSFYSLENFVTPDMPPAFIWHTVTDDAVSVQNSVMLASKMYEAGVSYELHVFPEGAHGLSLAVPEVDDPEFGRYADAHVAHWFPLCLEWLDRMK